MRTTLFPILLLALLAGCSTSNPERTDYAKDAGKGVPLEVPPDLVLPKPDDHYTVPEGTGAAGTSYSAYARSNGQGQACVCREAAAAPAGSAPPALPAAAPAPSLNSRSDGSKAILIAEPFDRCWLRVAAALEGAGIAVEDRDRSKGLFYLKGGKNQVVVKSAATGCEVAADNGSGATTDETRRTIEALYKKLGG